MDKQFIRHRTKVYAFGSRWSWHCLEPWHICNYGGSRRSWAHAFASAFRHSRVYN